METSCSGLWHPFARSGSVLTPVSSFPPLMLCVASPVTTKFARSHLPLLSKEYRDDCRRRFIRSQPVIISWVSRRLPQKIRVFIHRFQDTRKHQQELDIFMRRLSWLQQVLPIICGKGPVIMLSGTIHASKWLSCSRHFMPCWQATLFNVCITRWLWSTATLAFA